jgi:hypothetical protein
MEAVRSDYTARILAVEGQSGSVLVSPAEESPRVRV